MPHLHNHLRDARRQYEGIRYPDDLAAEVLARPRRWLWRIAVGACGASGLAAALMLVVVLDRAGKANQVGGVGGTAALVGVVPPPLPDGIGLVPPAAPLVPPAFPILPAPDRVVAQGSLDSREQT